MYLFFGDERKIKQKFSLLVFSIDKTKALEIELLIKNYRQKCGLPENYEFHFYRDSSVIKNGFGQFIFKCLVNTNLICKIYYTHIDFKSEPFSHIQAFSNIAHLISRDYSNLKVRFIFDKLGGDKTETIFKTEINRLCVLHNINAYKPTTFNNSKKSDFIQIADYLVALKDKGLI